MARIVTGRMRIELQPLASLSELVRVVADSFRPIALAKGISVYSTLDANTGPVEGDPERLQQVLWNLFSNAIRFTPAGGRIEILCQRSDEDVEVIVRDSGRGIRAEAVPHLFERYWQGQFESHPGQGLGLGLTIAHRIVSLHSGTVWAASEGEGLGATFTVRLPISESIPAAPAQATASPSTLGAYIRDAAALAAVDLKEPEPEKIETLDPGALDALRILLIDDHDAIAKACQRLLASHGHTVVRTAGLAGAMRALQDARVSHAAFDIVICDLSLPDGDGLELPARMTAFAATSDEVTAADVATDMPPAMAISGRVFKDDVARCLAAGFKEHLAKPFDETELLAAVQRVARRTGHAPVGEVLEAR